MLLFPAILQTVSAAPVAARMADDFVESAGVCTHLEYTDKAYYSQWPTVRQRLIDLGIRHIRDGSANADFVNKIRDLANTGIRTIWVLDPGAGVMPTQEFWTPMLEFTGTSVRDSNRVGTLTMKPQTLSLAVNDAPACFN